ncbi:hypothetical protein VTI28DRAFT_6652 [Corynascus sepedonium]
MHFSLRLNSNMTICTLSPPRFAHRSPVRAVVPPTRRPCLLCTCLVAVPADRVARPLPRCDFRNMHRLANDTRPRFLSIKTLTSKIPRSARTFGPAKNFMQGRHTRGTAGSDKCLSIESPRSSGAHSIGYTQAKEGRIKQTRSTQNHIARHASQTISADNCQGHHLAGRRIEVYHRAVRATETNNQQLEDPILKRYSTLRNKL